VRQAIFSLVMRACDLAGGAAVTESQNEGAMEQPDDAVLIGKGDTLQFLDLGLANRHGLIAGATGTGKTVSLQVLAEGLSAHGVPVFMADVKGDLSGLSQPGKPHPKIDERVRAIGLTDYRQRGFPTVFWDLFGEQGHPVRTTISETI
jgi:hypothetical protein